MESNSCTEDRIQHILERCLCDLGLHSPDQQLWNAGLCMNRWCLEELVKRDPRNFLILLQKILRKTKEVLERCQYELVVPLSLLFSSTLLSTPYVAPDCEVVWEAYLLFHSFLSWPEPCCSASKRLIRTIQQELRAPGISFQRLVRTEQGFSPDIHSSKTTMVLLVGPDEDVPPEVQSVSEQLSSSQSSSRDLLITLLRHSFQSVLGTGPQPQGLIAALQKKQPEELQRLLQEVTEIMEVAASTGDLNSARLNLLNEMERLRESLDHSAPTDGCSDNANGTVETFLLPYPKCHTRVWESDNFDVLNDILLSDSELEECFLKTELDEDDVIDTSVDEEDEIEGTVTDLDFQNHRISTTSSSSRDSTLSNFSLSSSWSVPSTSSGVDSDFGEDTEQEDAEEGQENSPKPRKKPKKKSRSLLGMERLSMLFKNSRSPSICRRAQSMGYRNDFTKDSQRTGLKPSRARSRPVSDPLTPLKHMCVRRRPILSCDDSDASAPPVLVKVVVFGGDKEAGRLSRAYSDLQLKESKHPRITKACRLQFYFLPTRRRSAGGGGHAPTDVQTGSLSRATSVDSSDLSLHDGVTHIGKMLGLMDPWYKRNVLSLLSLSSSVLCQAACKDSTVSESGSEQRPLLADLLLYYCRHAEQPVLLQLYQAELTLAGGARRREVFLHSLELGHSAGSRAVRALGGASKRFGMDAESQAVPLTLSVAYNKVSVSGRSQWIQTETACTSINLHKSCSGREQLWHDSRMESLQLTITEALKRNGCKTKKSHNQNMSVSEVKVDKLQVIGGGEEETFAVCLDQDEKKFIQSVTRCEVSLCCKPGSNSDWKSFKSSPGQVQPLHPSYCSLLCLPLTCFSASHP